MKNDGKSGGTESAKVTDWQVVVSKEIRIVEIREMTINMKHTRLKPVYSSAGDLTIVIPAESEDDAKKRALELAEHIASAGLWGLDFLNLADF